jgi:hypothetical protein
MPTYDAEHTVPQLSWEAPRSSKIIRRQFNYQHMPEEVTMHLEKRCALALTHMLPSLWMFTGDPRAPPVPLHAAYCKRDAPM